MAPQVMTRTRDELVKRRTELLARLGVADAEEAGARADAGELSGEDAHLVDLLRDVEFLLGGD